MEPKRYTVEYKGRFTTVRGQGACNVGARFLHAKRIGYEVIDNRTTIVQDRTSVDGIATNGEKVTVTELD